MLHQLQDNLCSQQGAQFIDLAVLLYEDIEQTATRVPGVGLHQREDTDLLIILINSFAAFADHAVKFRLEFLQKR